MHHLSVLWIPYFPSLVVNVDTLPGVVKAEDPVTDLYYPNYWWESQIVVCCVSMTVASQRPTSDVYNFLKGDHGESFRSAWSPLTVVSTELRRLPWGHAQLVCRILEFIVQIVQHGS